ncbi:PTS sugar transporter subunit IIA [bacterium]|nr:PTS sugar transporter subunit IIA [bacterium]
MDLLTLTHGRLVRLGLRASAKEGAIEALLDFLIEEREVPKDARESVLGAILNRERRLSTGLEQGVAIPHGITDAIEEEVAAIGVFPDGVPFDASDGLPARIVILLITPEPKRYRHVSNLAEIARQLRRRELREALCAAAGVEEAILALRAGG